MQNEATLPAILKNFTLPYSISKLSKQEIKEKKGLFARLKEGLGKTRNSFTEKIDSVFSVFKKIDEDLYDELEEAKSRLKGELLCPIDGDEYVI